MTPDERQDMPRDIVLETDGRFVVIGFFTPDYCEVARRFSRSLAVHNTPHHLFAAQANGEWGDVIMQKPRWLELASAYYYPGKTLILMDVDCEARAPFDDMIAAVQGDVGLSVRLRVRPRRQGRVLFSARVMVIRPTRPAYELIAAWRRACSNPHKPWFAPMSCERELVVAMAAEHGAAITFLPDRFSALEHHKAPADAVVVHDTEHGKRHAPSAVGKFCQSVFDRARGKTARAQASEARK